MTDKQIIIDGVDVSGCNRLNTFPMQFGEPHEICLTSLEQWGGQEKYCKDRPNCYYKQLEKLKAENLGFKILHESDKDLLKRKEQEYEELAYENYELNELFDRLKAENEKLDTENKRLVAELANPVFDSFEELDKLKQTLTEIKEIAITGLEGFCPKCSRKECEDNNCIETAIRDILQKISECEGNDETN